MNKFVSTILLLLVTLVTLSYGKEFDFSEHPGVTVLTGKTLNSFISSNKPSVVLYYGKNKESDKLIQNVFLKVADQRFEDENDDIAFGLIDLDTEIKARNTHSIDSTPTVIYYKKGVEVSEFLEGKKTKTSFEKFLKNPISPIKLSTGPGSWSQIESQVAHLNNRNFTAYLSNHPEGVLVMFFTAGCGHCTNMKPALAEASQIALKNNIGSIAAVDCGVSKKVCDNYKIDGFPTLYMFKNGKDTEKYVGDRSTDSLVEFLEKNVNTNTKKNNKKVKNEL